jgi:signal transduction histidine kinase
VKSERLPHPVSHPGPLARLVDDLPLGVAHLAGDGAVVAANPAASAMLEGAGGAELASALVRLVERAGAVRAPVAEATLPSSLGEVRVLLSPAEGEEAGWLALLHRDATRRLRDQTIALRGMLAAVVECERPEAALERALSALASVCQETDLTLWGAAEGKALEPLARARGPGQPPRDAADEAEGEALAARAVATGLPVHLPRVSRGNPYGLAPRGAASAALAIPVRDQGAVVGALCAVGTRLGEGEIRLLSGLADAAGSVLGRARAQQALREAEARADQARAVAVEREGLVTLGHLAACVTHEVASPLACLGTNIRAAQEAVVELLDLARGSGSAARAQEVAAELLEMLADSGGDLSRVASLVQSMRGLARRRADDRLKFDPRGPVEDAVRIFRGARHADVLLEQGPALPDVQGSPGLVCQVVLNLLDNGLDAMGGQGELAVRLLEDQGGVALEVTDRGAGIDPAIAPRVFDAYFTTKAPGHGTGLGLYICRDVVGRMGGTIGFDTGPQGTTFRVRLPAAP